MRKLPLVCSALALLCVGGPLAAADFSDPTWPCVQRKVDELSLGLMWPRPVPDGALPEGVAQSADTLVDTLVLRRVSLEEAEQLIEDFAGAHPDLTADDYGMIFRDLFERIGRDRREIIGGIERYSLQQISLSGRIEESRSKMSELMAAEEPDFDQVDVLEETLDWDERIFRDRAKSLTYVCETPVLLEKRVYSLAQILLGQVPD